MALTIVEAERLYLRIAAEQYGLINRAQLIACGLDHCAIYRRVRAGRLVPVLPGVYLVAGSGVDELMPPMAAALWAPSGLVSHTTAAALRQWDGFHLQPVHLSVPGRLAPAGDVVVHEYGDFFDDRPVRIGGIPVTSAARTVFDLAAIGHHLVEKALDESRRRGQAALSDYWELLERPESFGRRGRRVLGKLVEARTGSTVPTDTELEEMFMRIVRRYRLPIPRSQFPVRLSSGAIRLDFAYPERRIAIECDSYAWHMDRAAFERDRARDLEMQGLGWVVLRFTWSMLKWRHEYVANQVRHQHETRPPITEPSSNVV